MPFALRKAPKRDLYWVVNKESKQKYSKEPIPKEKAEAQLRILEKTGKGYSELAKHSMKQNEVKATKKKLDVLTPELERVIDETTEIPEDPTHPVYKLIKDESEAQKHLERLHTTHPEPKRVKSPRSKSKLGRGKDCGCGGGKHCISKLRGGAVDVESKTEVREREKAIEKLVNEGMNPQKAAKQVTTQVKKEAEEARMEKAGGSADLNAVYLAKEYNKAFPLNRKTGSALDKHMTDWVRGQLKKMDCGCGCKGMKKLAELSGAATASGREKRVLQYGERHKRRLKGGKMVDCPAGYRNDGLTCLEECKADETDTGLTCVKKCPGGYRDDGVACRKCPDGYTDTGAACIENCKSGETDTGGFCKSGCPGGYRDDGTYCRKCPEGYKDTGLSCFRPAGGGQCSGGDCRTYECGRLRGAFGEDWGPKYCTECRPIKCEPIIPADTKPQDAFPNTRAKKSESQMVIWKVVRGKDIKGRVDVNGTMEEIGDGLKKAFADNGDLAKLFNPELNGIGPAFRKFGRDTDEAFAHVGSELLKAFDPATNGVGKAFEQLGQVMKDTLGNESWWRDTMSNPDTYIMLLGMIASAAATILSAGTLGPAAFIALQALGPATKMIGDAAQGRPLDGLDIAGLVMGLVPIPGASAAAKQASEAIIKAAAFGTTAAKALPYVQKATQVGKFIAEGVKVAQDFGLVPQTCLTNCPPPPPPPENEFGEQTPCQEACGRIELGYDDVELPEGCDCDDVGEAEDLDIELEDEGSIDFGSIDEDAGFGEGIVGELDDEELADAAEEVGLDDEELEEFGGEVEEGEEVEEEVEEEELTPDEEVELEDDFNLEEEEPEETPNAMLTDDVFGEHTEEPEMDSPCRLKFFRIYGMDAEEFLDLPEDMKELIAESKGKTSEDGEDAAHKALGRSGSGGRRKMLRWNKWA